MAMGGDGSGEKVVLWWSYFCRDKHTPTFCVSCSHSWGFSIDRGGSGADGASLRPTENKHLNYYAEIIYT